MRAAIILIGITAVGNYRALVSTPFIKRNQKSAITFILNGGRLGDNLRNYWQAKYLSYIYGLDLLCPMFAYADHLVLGLHEKKYAPSMDQQFQNVIHLPDDLNQNISAHDGILYKIGFKFISKHGDGIRDLAFTQAMKELIKPARALSLVKKAHNRINIALHIRCGSGVDRNKSFLDLQRRNPTKFPPLSFYVDALKRLVELFAGRPLRAHVFTDADEPQSLVEQLQEPFKDVDITFTFRKDNSQGDQRYLLIDLFSMANFDCLIRSTSSFAVIGQRIGNHQVVIFPKIPQWQDDVLYIKELGVVDRRTRY